MKKTSLSLLSILIFAFTSCKKDTPQPTPNPNPKSDTIAVSENITQSTVWYKDSTYMIKGFVFVKNGATLIIQPGTKILGDRASKGTLIITRGSRIIADGAPNEPIVFTSAQPDSMKTYGDWGGLVILGNATINVPGGTALIEGGLLGQDATYGGTNDNDNSGTLRYVRIEYGGIAYQPNNEINGLTFGGVGRGTIVENVQVSYAGDDAFEWFGGTVNCKNLIAYKCWDDDFDTDFGFRGMIQFGLIIRDHNIADQSQSNGFESDNDGTGSTNTPQTAPVFSNITLIGPKYSGTPNALYRRAAHLRRNTSTSIYNSIFVGYPTGLHIDGVSAQSNATNDLLQLERITLVNMTNDFEQTNGANSWAGMNDYFNSPNRENATTNILELNSNYLPLSTSNLLNKASFTNPKLNNPFFTPVPYVGAFGTTNWTLGWARFQ
jgi:hypothetical protein